MFGARPSPLDRGLDAFGVRRWKAARRHLEDSAIEDQRPIGDYHLGLLYWRGLGGPRDEAAAIRCFRRAAEAGHAAAQTALGAALSAGDDDERAEAKDLFRNAAGAGDPEAMTRLADLSEPQVARDLLERAAETGHAPAMLELAARLMRVDPVEALGWLYAAAATSGADEAKTLAIALAKEMHASEIGAAQKIGRMRAKRVRASL